MEDTCSCPNCGSESAYFNGVCYECPDCDHEWGEIELENDDEDDNDEDEF